MAECLEAGITVACSLTAQADAAEGNVDVCDVHESVVMNEVARKHVVVYPARIIFVVAEDVAGKRRRILFDDFACFAFWVVGVE